MGSIKEELASQFRSLSIALTISMSVVFSIFAGAITGYYLDLWLFDGQSHWLTIICLFLGIAGAAKNFLVLTKRFTQEPGEKKGKDQPGAHTSGRQDDV
jgi:F0F1-type ATP synthase assembly protein I